MKKALNPYSYPSWIHGACQRSLSVLANHPLLHRYTVVFCLFKGLHGSFLGRRCLYLCVNVSAGCCATLSFLRATRTLSEVNVAFT